MVTIAGFLRQGKRLNLTLSHLEKVKCCYEIVVQYVYTVCWHLQVCNLGSNDYSVSLPREHTVFSMHSVVKVRYEIPLYFVTAVEPTLSPLSTTLCPEIRSQQYQNRAYPYFETVSTSAVFNTTKARCQKIASNNFYFKIFYGGGPAGPVRDASRP